MPSEMFIRTSLEYTGLSDPNNEFTLKQYQLEKGVVLSYPISRSIFIDYGLWFIEKTKISIEKALVTNISLNDGTFKLETEKNEVYSAKKVIVAVGLLNAYYIPPIFLSLPKEFISHNSQYTNFLSFENKKVVVVGGGQSAWEAPALLHQSRATVNLVDRRSKRLSLAEKKHKRRTAKISI